MSKKYKYYYRPEYGSDKLLIEFFEGVGDDSFFKDLLEAIADIQPVVKHIEDIRVIDDMALTIETDYGEFLYSKDIWNMAIIMSESNQRLIDAIEEHLSVSPYFEREAWVNA
ncbi:hypothetical protein SAMN05421788_112118 [Filimonas lacunae]|uniref:Uncharacterized protein n=1 Tax=Filimonas lacunae TaxID=477680 RepID=A0A173MLF4_9BACT|nr:hypothetical protein [Filimonas lacunae]BAV08310.1 hypothetical protein FLA_4346 [Filimonas lacunae]SIT33324.1 hypothetical protein SAMN05421788_112118 [Filimonas lacunae]